MTKFTTKNGLFAAFVLTVALCSCKGKQQDNAQAQQQVPELATVTVGTEDATLETGYPATLHGKNDVEIRPQISGFITKVCIEEGQHVSKGQLLFTIDRVQLQAAVEAAKGQVNQAQAAVAAAQANQNTAQTSANNNKMLFDKNIIAQSVYQTSVDAVNAARAQVMQAKAALESANAQLVSAEKNLSFSNVTAPAAGVVGTIDFKEGALVSPQSLLTILSNNSDMEAYFSMNEKEVLALTDNGKRSLQAALASLPEVSLRLANGEIYPFKGHIVSMSGVLDPQTGSATMKALFPNPDGLLHSGNTGNVLIPNVSRDVIMVPQKATTEILDQKYVFVLDKNNVAHRTPITISDENDGQSYIITSGLKPGDRVVIEGIGITVKDEMQIKPKQ